jgi:hypothetical protein
MKKPAVGLFHNSSAESEAPGTEINSPISPPNQIGNCRHARIGMFFFYAKRINSPVTNSKNERINR